MNNATRYCVGYRQGWAAACDTFAGLKSEGWQTNTEQMKQARDAYPDPPNDGAPTDRNGHPSPSGFMDGWDEASRFLLADAPPMTVRAHLAALQSYVDDNQEKPTLRVRAKPRFKVRIEAPLRGSESWDADFDGTGSFRRER